ncbi:rRNA cytosine-C5-methyltransferase [Sulfolobus acidocaldarius SUSAZ]|nr:rRNA cytosine-C5-methyltransferase [Sulfolobus acidocaldarius SUSAZ]
MSLELLLSRVLFYVEKGYPLPVAFKRAKNFGGYRKINYNEAYELSKKLILSYYSLTFKTRRKKVKEFLRGKYEVKFPEWMEIELSKIYDVNSLKFWLLNKQKFTWFRVNTLIADEEKVIKNLTDKGVDVEKDSEIPYAYKTLDNITDTTEFKENKIIVQDKASMAVVEALKPEPNDQILDLASAPGIKVSQIMQLTENKAKLLVADIDKERLEKERLLLKKFGVNVDRLEFLLVDSANLAITRKVNKVLLDAPCSSSGAIWNEPTILLRLTMEKVLYYADQQRRLLNNAAKLGGEVIYATCSMFMKEGELIVNDYTTQRPLSFGLDVKHGIRFVPYLHDTEGFFITKLSV